MMPCRSALLLAGITVSLFLLGCGDAPDEQGTTPAPEIGTDRSGADAGQTGEAVCLEAEPFVADGPIPVESASDGQRRRISDIRWSRHEGCERIVIDVAADERLELPGEVRAEVLREVGIVRIHLPNVYEVDAAVVEERFDGQLVEHSYAVLSREGRWIFVDLHLGSAAEAHVATLRDPVRVVVDLRPGGEPIPPRATTGERIVVIQPRPGPVSYPLEVAGYGRTFEANVVARLEQGGETVADTFTTATGWAEAWGYYSVTFDEGPAGPLELHVGEYSARDGSWEGVEVDIEVQ